MMVIAPTSHASWTVLFVAFPVVETDACMWLSGGPAGGAKGWWAAGFAFAEGSPKVWKAGEHPRLDILGS